MNTASLLVLALGSLLLTGCGKSKIEQCNAFVDRATQSQTAINALKLDSEDPKELEAGATSVEADAKSFAALPLKDEKLIGFRTAYAATLASLASVLHELANLQKDAKDPTKQDMVRAQFNRFNADADRATKAESDLVDQINGYCTGSK